MSRGNTLELVGSTALVQEVRPKLLLSDLLYRFRARADVDGQYLAYFLGSKCGRHQIEQNAVGTSASMKKVSKETVAGIVVAMPEPVEQRVLRSYLDRETTKIDALIAEQEHLIALLAEKRQAMISHAVTKGLDPVVPMKDSGVMGLGEIPEHWQVVPLKRLISAIDQGDSPQCESEAAAEGAWGVLKVGCVNGGAFSPDEQKALPAGVDFDRRAEVHAEDLLMSRGNTLELVGSAAFVRAVRPRLLLSDLLYRFRAKANAEGLFLSYFLGSKWGRRQIEQDAVGTSASMKKVSKEAISAILVAVPGVSEQRSILCFLDRRTERLDALTAEAQRAIDLLRERRSALISAAVTGQIDVRGALEPAS